MKFLAKRADSLILKGGVTYKPKGDNSLLREMLVAEQHGFCAYTEKRLEPTDSCEIEHFDPRQKYSGDDYYNYYATLRSANQRKRGKEKKHAGAEFFASRFFQDRQQLAARVRYVPGEFVYEAVKDDQEAADLIDYLGLNDYGLCEQRRAHAMRLKGIFGAAGYDRNSQVSYLFANDVEQSFITALEAELDLDLSALLEDG